MCYFKCISLGVIARMRQKKDFTSVELTFYVSAVPGCSFNAKLTVIPKIKTISENCCGAYCPQDEKDH